LPPEPPAGPTRRTTWRIIFAADGPSRITFNRPFIVGQELDYIRQSVEAMHTAGDGGFTRRCRELLRRELGASDVLFTPSCTDALEMCALLLDLQPGDEVILPSFAFVSCVNAFVLRGAKPVFADIREDTLNIDESQVERLITPRTRAVLALHYAGVACEMDALLPLSESSGVPIIEDNAHGLFATYRGRRLGTMGRLATQSFHETKNFICGEGGALVINDPSLVERAEIIRAKGTNRQQFFRGQVDKYTWVDIGSSFVLSDILAAFLLAQLEAREEITGRRRAIWERYDRRFRGSLEAAGVGLPTVPDHCEQSYHMYYLLLPSLDLRQRLIAHLKSRNIDAVFHYTPLHCSEMGLREGHAPIGCPVTERVSDTLLRLPFYYDLGAEDQERVIAEIDSFLQRRS